MPQIPAPLYRDPLYDGAADPMVIYNPFEEEWWMLYTQRRANQHGLGVSYCYGCNVGVAASKDGNYWYYRGALALDFERGTNTFWAPEVILDRGVYHMYVSYTRGAHNKFCGMEQMMHYTSRNLWDWQCQGPLSLSSGSVIDACVHPLPHGGFRMWYKNEEDHSHTWAADSADLTHWQVCGPVIADRPHEGPNVFQLGGYYWMVVDAWCGQGVYRSGDLENWRRQENNILLAPGKRTDDGSMGLHADVLVSGQNAYIFYFTHPERTRDFQHGDTVPYRYRRSSVQAAELTVEGDVLCCDRDAPFTMTLVRP